MQSELGLNLSVVPDHRTARTMGHCARTRAENLAIMGVGRVSELCCGPSLWVLTACYALEGIGCVGNDIDPRWVGYSRGCEWVIGDCLEVPWEEAAVFAPPLSRGCTGRREDSLRAQWVSPSYRAFADEVRRRDYRGVAVMVLPGRSWTEDRSGLHWALSLMGGEAVPLYDARNRVVKYVDVYVDLR